MNDLDDMASLILFGDPDQPAGGGLLPGTLEAAGIRIISIGPAPATSFAQAGGQVIDGLRTVYGPRSWSGDMTVQFHDEAAIRRALRRTDIRHIDTPKAKGKRARRRAKGKARA